jgi:hypothetical protein
VADNRKNFYKSSLHDPISAKRGGITLMFTFLTRLGRLVVCIPIVIAVTAIIGFGVLSTVPAASKHKDPGSCTIAMGSVISGQQRLLVTASGLSINTDYLEAQPGVQSLWVTTDANGSVSNQSLWYHGPGKYTIDFDYYYWQNSKLVQATATSCSANL